VPTLANQFSLSRPTSKKKMAGRGARLVVLSLVFWLVIQAILSTGWAANSPEAKRHRELLAPHPTNEIRMSNHAEPGLGPTGVWRIRGLHNTIYLVGTPDLVTSNQVPFPSSFYAAYRDSKEIYIELDDDPSVLGKMSLPFKLMKWVKAHAAELYYPKGRTLQDELSAGTVQRLKEFYGKNYSKQERMTPLFLAFMGESEAFANEHTNDCGVEEVFVALARNDGKRLHALDDNSVDDLALLMLDEMLLNLGAEISRRGADAVVEEKVLGVPDGKKPVEKTDWRYGDLTATERENEQTKRRSPALYKKLVPERNRKWMGKLKSALQGRKNAMVLIESKHLCGTEGLLQLLRNAGFTVEQMYGVDRPLAPPGGMDKAPR